MAKKGGKQIGGDNNPATEIDLTTLSKEQLLELAKEKGIGFTHEMDTEAIIKAIADFVDPPPEKTEGNGEDGKMSSPPEKPPEPPKDSGSVVIKSVKRAGKTTTAVTGKPIIFDKDGIATVDPKDAEYLIGISDIVKA
jgi:hypothetical protein